MAPPNKRQRQLRRLLDAKKDSREIRCVELELEDDVQTVIGDDDFDIDGMVLDQELVRSRWEDLIKWNPAAEHSMRSAYTGDSRATKYRKLKDKEQRHPLLLTVQRSTRFSLGPILQ